MEPALLDAQGNLRLDWGRRAAVAKVIGDFAADNLNGVAFDFPATPAPGSERAVGRFGDFVFGQDTAANGTKNWGILDQFGNVLVSFTQGAAAASPGAMDVPGQTTSRFGLSSAVIRGDGNINLQVSAAGVQPGATGADNVLAVFSLPANAFDAAGRGLCIQAAGSYGATANTKRVKIIANPATAVVGSTVGGGGTTIADSAAVATNGGGWSLQGYIYKYGANGSNTQIGVHQQAQNGAAVAALLAPSLITAAENGAILIAVTGNATTAATDILFNLLAINAMN